MEGVAYRSSRTAAALFLAAMLFASVPRMIHAQDFDSYHEETEGCGLWLGPSPVKEQEEHGWGHSMFTGKFIPKGTVLLGSGIHDDEKQAKVFGDLFVPVYDWEALDMAEYARPAMEDDMFPDDDDEERMEERMEQELEAQRAAGAMNGTKSDPPLFQELWSGDIYDAQILESYDGMRVFVPGLAIIAPCTADGFNLEQVQTMFYRDWRDVRGRYHDDSPPHPQAGSFSYLSNAMFVAARDILPGEELIVECVDNGDDFDPKDYDPVDFKPSEAGGYSICLDDRVEERLADHTPNVAGGDHGGQRGLFAKKKLEAGEILTSSPMIPVHREEMHMDRKKYQKLHDEAKLHGNYAKNGLPAKKQQLLLNYMYGHPESSLLWLPTAPLIHAVNHAAIYDPDSTVKAVEPNAKIQWHSDKYTEAQAAGKPLSRRQQFHHKELLEMDSLEVVKKHGMGLMIDLVATRPIKEGDEILIDYGKHWDDAMKRHVADWASAVDAIKLEHAEDKAERKRKRKLEREREELAIREEDETPHVKHKHRHKRSENAMTAIPLSGYVTAADYNDMHQEDPVLAFLEQRKRPYPSNLETACYFDGDWLDDMDEQDEEADPITYESWYNQIDPLAGCLLPCLVTERRPYIEGEEEYLRTREFDDDDNYMKVVRETERKNEPNGGSASPVRYTVKLIDSHEENTSIPFECHIYKRFDYYLTDVPREGITFVNKPHSTDHWIDYAFRQPVGLPDDMVPQAWRDRATRRVRGRARTGTKKEPKPMTMDEELEEFEYQESVKRWNDIESRRERLEETEEKRMSAREDL